MNRLNRSSLVTQSTSNLRPSGSQSRILNQSYQERREEPVARSQYVLDNEILTFSRFKDDKVITRETTQVKNRQA